MKLFKLIVFISFVIIGQIFFVSFVFASSSNGTIDSTYRYAWGENIGWIDFGTSNGNVRVADSGLSGYALSETSGWIYLDDVENDGAGNLSGYAWSENTGYINFAPDNGGVIINSSGEFTGSALSENVGWIIFDGDYAVKTDWRPQSERSQCNNASDDDGDGLTDYPDDPGCSSLTDDNETDPSGGGGLPSGAYNPPSSPASSPSNPKAEFKVIINNDKEYTNNRNVTLNFIVGNDTEKMAISSSSDFLGPGTGQIPYEDNYNWDLCYMEKNCIDGSHKVYVKFYTKYGQPSEIVTDEIILDITPPKLENINIKAYYYSTDNIIVSGKTESNAEIYFHYNGKYGSMIADESGSFKVNLGKLTVGEHVLEVILKDWLGNTSEPLIYNLNIIEPGSVDDPGEEEEEEEEEEEKEEEEEEEPEEIITVPEQAPISLMGEWDLLPSEAINQFVLAPLPDNIKLFAGKFPYLEETFSEVGIVKITDVYDLKTTDIYLPKLADIIEAPNPELGLGEFSFIEGTPIAELPADIKEKIPDNIIFAKSGDKMIDLNISLSVTDTGELEQSIAFVPGKQIELIIKPEDSVKSVKGYLLFQESFVEEDKEKRSFLASLVSIFEDKEEPEQGFAVSEFNYYDEDGDGIYIAKINAPVVEGKYEIITIVDYENPELGKREYKLITVIDPEGYVYEKIGDKEARISGAKVSLYWLNQETNEYELWPAKEYQQENPQITNNTGKYSFLVPEGSYYLQAEASNYLLYKGDAFQVSGGKGVHFNIELKPKYWWLKYIDWKLGLLILIVVLLLYNFYKDKLREKLIKKT